VVLENVPVGSRHADVVRAKLGEVCGGNVVPSICQTASAPLSVCHGGSALPSSV